eukprot:1304780-Heterocapsa_arctica.AAC.2
MFSTTASPCLRPLFITPGDHWQAAGLPVSVRWPEVRGSAERPGRFFQCAGRKARRGNRQRPLGHGSDHRITGELPGYLSLCAAWKFAVVPNVLASISKVPAAKLAAEFANGRLATVAFIVSLASSLAT